MILLALSRRLVTGLLLGRTIGRRNRARQCIKRRLDDIRAPRAAPRTAMRSQDRERAA